MRSSCSRGRLLVVALVRLSLLSVRPVVALVALPLLLPAARLLPTAWVAVLSSPLALAQPWAARWTFVVARAHLALPAMSRFRVTTFSCALMAVSTCLAALFRCRPLVRKASRLPRPTALQVPRVAFRLHPGTLLLVTVVRSAWLPVLPPVVRVAGSA